MNQALKFNIMKMGGGGRVFVGCQGGCERRIEVIVKIKGGGLV